MLTCRSALLNHEPHHARPAGGGVVRVVVHVVLPLVVEQKFLHGRSDTDAPGAAEAEKLTSRTRLGPQPMPSVLAEEMASDGANAGSGRACTHHRSMPMPVASELAQRSSQMYTEPDAMLQGG